MERRVVETREAPVHDREVVVTDGGGGGGFAAVLLAILGIVVVLILGYFLVTSLGAGSDSGSETNIEAPAVEVPDEINVDVNEGGGGE